MKKQYIDLAIAVKEYFTLSNGVVSADIQLRLIELEKTIKEKVGVE